MDGLALRGVRERLSRSASGRGDDQAGLPRYYTQEGDASARSPATVGGRLQAAVLNDYLGSRLGVLRSPRLPLGRLLPYGLGPIYARLARCFREGLWL